MKFNELVERLNDSGRDASRIVAWRVGPDDPLFEVEYSIIRRDSKYAIASLVNDRSNGEVLLHKQTLSDGSRSVYFDSESDACGWVWARVTSPAFVPEPVPELSPEEAKEQRQRQTERVMEARKEHMRANPELWADYFREHPDERP